MRARRFVIALAVGLAGACSSGDDPTIDAAPAATSTTAPTTTTTTTVGPQPATASCPAVPARASAPSDRPTYTMDLTIDLEHNVVVGRQTVRFTPDLPTDRLVFRLWPNGPRSAQAGARLDVEAVYLGGTAPVPTEQPDATTLVVPLADPLAAGETVEATVPWRLTLPGPVMDRISRRGDTLRLGTFHPLLAWEPGVGWGMEPPTALFAEASVAPVADWSVGITAPAGLDVFATGAKDGGRWVASAVREVAVAVGRFRVVTGIARAPHPVEVVVAVESGLTDDGGDYLATVTRALEDFGVRFGAYPYERYVLVLTPDLNGGIEYPAFVHQGPGTGGRSTPHEVGHQWFYALVGNHQGRDPWIDEGFATWAEGRFLGTLGSILRRDVPADAQGHAGEPMTYWEAHAASYYRGVYTQGAQVIGALGDADLVDCALRHHVARNANAVVTNRDVLAALQVVFPDAERVLARYGIRVGA